MNTIKRPAPTAPPIIVSRGSDVDDGVTLVGVSVVDDDTFNAFVMIIAIVLTDTVGEVDIMIMDDDAHVLVPTMLVSSSPEPEPLAFILQFAYATIKIKVFINNNNISPLKQSQYLLQQLYILGILQQHNNY